MDLNILYEDNHLIVVEKQPGVLTQHANLNLPVLLDEVKKYIKEKYNKPGNVFLGMVHRLDTNVGGIVVFAKTSKAASRLNNEIREKRFYKKYLTIVEGTINTQKEITLIDYLYKDNKNKKSLISTKDRGKKSILTFKKIKSKNNLTLLDINLITGRYHQIRRQLSNYGYPIFGDKKYGSKTHNNELLLYAYYLKFKHPTKDEFVEIKHYPKNDKFNELIK